MSKLIKENQFFIFDNPQTLSPKYYAKLIVTKIQTKYYQHALNQLSIKNIDNKKYYVSICGIFKNEAPYLKEWIEYHRIVGIDHIYLYNNNSSDDFYQVLKSYIHEGYVDLINWPYNQKQMEAYRDCAKRAKSQTFWLGFIDIDEFVVPLLDNNIGTFLKRFQNRPSVLLYWKMFGTNGIKSRDLNSLVTESFISCWPKYDDIGKCFFNTDFEISYRQPMLHHMLWVRYNEKDYPPVNCFDEPCVRAWYNPVPKDTKDFPVQINHYVLKSYNEYMSKVKKTDVFFTSNPKGKEHFEKHESLSTGTDTHVFKYLEQLKGRIN